MKKHTPKPAKYFAFPPYKAELFCKKTGWAGVMNRIGFNCLVWHDENGKSTGKTIADFATAQRIAHQWNIDAGVG